MSRSVIARWLRGRPAEAGEPVPDAELLARFAGAGDEAAFELIVWRHAALVLGVCRRVVRDDHLAEDAFQAVFLVLARKAGAVRGANVPGWLFRVARRVAARARRQVEARAKHEAPLAAEPIGPPLPCPAEDRECLAVLDAEVARLPERLRRPVLLCYLGGRTTEDAARVLGCPRGTVLSRLATARQRLAARLTRRGVVLPASVLGTVAVPSVSGVVPPTIRAALLFPTLASRLAPTNPILLANGALSAMKLTNTLTAATVLLVAGGLFGGFALITRGGGDAVALAAADPPKAEPQKPKTPEVPKAPPTDRERQREVEARRLDELRALADTLRQEIERLHRHVDELQLTSGAGDPETRRRRADLAARSHELDRELLVDEVRELARKEREARRRFLDAEQQPAGDDNHQRFVASVQKLAKKAAEELQAAKTAVKKLDEQYADRMDREDSHARGVRAGVSQLTRTIEVKTATLARTEVEMERLSLQVRGVELTDQGRAPTSNQLDELLKEVRELRREVQELKRK